MRLVSFQLRNFMSFSDTGNLQFSDGFNVIVGQNNAGKSALLQGISLRFGDKPHLSLQTKPTSTTPVSPQSEALFTLECGGQELRTILLNRGAEFGIPIPAGSQPNPQLVQDILSNVFSSQRLLLWLRRTGGGRIETTETPSFADYTVGDRDMVVRPTADRMNFEFVRKQSGDPIGTELGAHIGQSFRDHLYFFHAERLKVAERSFGASPVLIQDASNLPEVLNVLQSNMGRFNRFNRLVSDIFPTIRRVAVRPHPSTGNLQIVVWSVDPETEREDLAISLADSGTGVGQTLAILYVAVTSDTTIPRTIIIDEPNSFLNPGAAKKLVSILRGFSHIQFIISTHSPEIIRAAQPQTLSVIHWSNGASTVEQLEASKINSLQLVLNEVGASLSDVFGADRVLWVEGPTEEICFRVLIERYLKRPLMGTAIAAVRDLGRLTSRKPSATLIWEIYTKLSGAGALMPPALAFSFDREGRNEKEMTDIRRQSGNKVHFLRRRMFENYLLDPEAIAAVLSQETSAESGVFVGVVRDWFTRCADEFLPAEVRGTKADSTTWFREVDGYDLLYRVFSEASDNKVCFDKVRHGLMLTEWLIEKKPDSLAELGKYLEQIIGGANPCKSDQRSVIGRFSNTHCSIMRGDLINAWTIGCTAKYIALLRDMR